MVGDNHIYGIGHGMSQGDGHEAFFYSWDIRWDLYKQLGYPEVNDLDDLYDLFVAMKEICPTDDNGNPTYAFSLWPDWDDAMVMYVKSFVSAYYGYDELGRLIEMNSYYPNAIGGPISSGGAFWYDDQGYRHAYKEDENGNLVGYEDQPIRKPQD